MCDYRDDVSDLHVHFERLRESEEPERSAREEAARCAAEDAEPGTLRQLLEVYVGHLEKHGKQSAKDVRSIFNAHVFHAAPDIAERKATQVAIDQFVGLISTLTEAGKGRTAAKLRSYLRAAYSLAIGSKIDPDAPFILRSFETNPVASVGVRALSKYNRVRSVSWTSPKWVCFFVGSKRCVMVYKRTLKVPSDVRAQLLSRRLGGVQNRYCNHRYYALEKKQAPERWARHLTKLGGTKGVDLTVPREGAADVVRPSL
jgi:hypothetical protein